MRNLNRIAWLILGMTILLSAPEVRAQDAAATPPLSIKVTERAVVTVMPDRAEIDVGVTTQRDTSRTAVAENARLVNQATEALRKAAGPKATVETVTYSVRPEYRYPREGGEPTIAGYVATNVVRVTLDDLARVGEVIDAAAAAGANRVQRVEFTLKDDRKARAEALRVAAQRARSQADALASALDVTIVRVLSAVESQPVVRPFPDAVAFRAEAASTATPIEPGPLDIDATVILTVEIAPGR